MNKIKLTIQNGHRNVTNGQTGTSGIVDGKKVYEVDWIDKVYFALKAKIDSTYSDSIELSYDDCNVQNGAFADIFVAIHFDGSTNKSYNGGFVDCSPNSYTKDEDWKLAQTIGDAYFIPMGIKFAPEHRTDNSTYYYAFQYTGENTKQTIIECGTMTNDSDMTKLADYTKIGELILQGIVNYIKVLPNVSIPPPTLTEVDLLKKQLTEKDILISTQSSELLKLKETLARTLEQSDIYKDRWEKTEELRAKWYEALQQCEGNLDTCKKDRATFQKQLTECLNKGELTWGDLILKIWEKIRGVKI